MKWKEKYARKKLNKLVVKVIRQPYFPNLAKVKSVGVIWQPTQKEAFNWLKNQFNREHLIFRGFCVFEDAVNPPDYTNTITTNDLDWWGLPKPGKTEEFTSIQFDLLLNLAPRQNLMLDYISALSNARFKVGCTESETNFFDLNINIGENDDAMYLAKQQIFYLAQLNKKTTT